MNGSKEIARDSHPGQAAQAFSCRNDDRLLREKAGMRQRPGVLTKCEDLFLVSPPRIAPRLFWRTCTSATTRADVVEGYGLIRTSRTMVNIVAAAAIPAARLTMAAAAKPGLARRADSADLSSNLRMPPDPTCLLAPGCPAWGARWSGAAARYGIGTAIATRGSTRATQARKRAWISARGGRPCRFAGPNPTGRARSAGAPRIAGWPIERAPGSRRLSRWPV